MSAVNRKIIYLAVVVLAVALLLGLWLQHGRQQERVILIVTKNQDYTPSLNPTRLQKAAALALEDYGKARVPALKITHHIISYSGDEEEGYKEAEAFLQKNNNNVMALVGDFNSTGTEYLSRLAARHEIPHLSFFATDESIFVKNPWSFSYRPRVQTEIEQMLELLKEKLAARQIIVLASEQQNLLYRAEMFRAAANAQALEIIDYSVLPREQNDFRTKLRQMNDSALQVDTFVLFLSPYQLEHFMQQRALESIHKPVLSTGIVIHPELLPVFHGVDKAFYTLIPCFFQELERDPALQSFAHRYIVETGFHRIDTLGPTIYDGFWTLYESMEQAANRKELKEALQAHSQERYVGPIAFNRDGLLSEECYVAVKIRSGRFEEVDLP